MSDLVEIVARGLIERQIRYVRKWDTNPEDLEKLLSEAVDRDWALRLGDAKTAIRAIEGAGKKIVGREATEEMLVNGREALLPIVPREKLTTYGPVQGVWSDMLDAADTFGGA